MWFDKAVIYQIYPLGLCGAPEYNDGVEEHRVLRVLDWVGWASPTSTVFTDTWEVEMSPRVPPPGRSEEVGQPLQGLVPHRLQRQYRL